MVDLTQLKFKRTLENEVYRCCMQVGYDWQSGPIYCGDIAEYVSPSVEGNLRYIAALCERHGGKCLNPNQIIK